MKMLAVSHTHREEQLIEATQWALENGFLDAVPDPTEPRDPGTGESLRRDRTAWFSNHGYFALDQFFETFEEFEEAAQPTPKRRRERNNNDYPPLRLADVPPTPPHQARLRETREVAVAHVLAQLQAHYQDAIWRRFFDCLTLEEMGRMRNVSYQSVQDVLKRAHRDFRLRWNAEVELLDAKQSASYLGKTPRYVRSLASSLGEKFRPYVTKPKLLWKRDQVTELKSFLSPSRDKTMRRDLGSCPVRYVETVGDSIEQRAA